jgi:mono/diheme cytochrome c family protein
VRPALAALALALACDAAPNATTGSTPATPPADAPDPVVADAAAPFSEAWLQAQADRYLSADGAHRRRALERSLRSPTNIYSRTRLSAYGLTELGWDLLPEWTPRVRTIDGPLAAALVAGHPLDLADAAKIWDGQRPTSLADWQALGRRVFFGYPLRPEVFAEHALTHPDVARSVGLRAAPDGSVPGVVAFADIDGRARVGITCALCHVAVTDAGVVVGRARRDFDYGAMRLAFHRDTGAPLDARMAERMATWGPGRADITEDDDEDPVAIPDLWHLESLHALTQAATLRHAELGEDAPLALAIRQETQILHANRERTRPPRELAWALAMFLYSLEPPPRPAGEAAAPDPAVARGDAIFRRDCVACHDGPTGSGAPLPADAIGTDPALAHGTSRGTGVYRPAPLLRVADAAPYFHHGVVASLEQLFDPARLAVVPGHAPGTDLPPPERADLIAYLRTL